MDQPPPTGERGVGERERARKRRWISPQERVVWKRFLRARDGALCHVCRKSEHELLELQIDHMNGDPNDWREENLQLLCASCNTSEYRRREKELLHEAYRVGRVSVSENLRLEREAVEVRERGVDFGLSLVSASAELKVNRDKEPWFRREVLWKVGHDGFLTVDAALHEISEIVALSPVTARRYLKKMTSAAGPLIVEETPSGGRLLKLRPEYWKLETTSQVEKDGK